jgi:aryl-alcohol dehydrogenase-like predicted oxidoreductase
MNTVCLSDARDCDPSILGRHRPVRPRQSDVFARAADTWLRGTAPQPATIALAMPAPRRTDLDFGRVGLGTGPLGGLYEPVSDEDAAATLHAAWADGVRYFDTAPHYGVGLAERRLGTFVRDLPRDNVIISTKVGRLLVEGDGQQGDQSFWGVPEGLVRQPDYSGDGVRRSILDSLERMGLERIDVALIHDPDDHWEHALRFAYPALADLRAQGVVRAIGVGMNQWQMLTRFVRETDIDVVLVAGRYTLLDQSAAEQLLPACLEHGVSVIAGGVFNSGVLADPSVHSRYDYGPVPPALLERAQEIERVCHAYDVPLVAAAIQFPLHHPAVTAVLVGARSPIEVSTDLALARQPIPAELWSALDDLT